MRFLGRSPRSSLPSSMLKTINRDDLVKTRMKKQIKIAEKKGRTSKDEFKNGDKIVVRDPISQRWCRVCLIIGERDLDNITPVSFIVELESGNRTIRHKSHMRHAVKTIKKVDSKRVRFMQKVEHSDGSDSAITEEKPAQPHTRLGARPETK